MFHQADAHDFLYEVINHFENDILTHTLPDYQKKATVTLIQLNHCLKIIFKKQLNA